MAKKIIIDRLPNDGFRHPRHDKQKRDEIELFLRDAYAAGCRAAQAGSMVTALEYAAAEAPKLRALIRVDDSERSEAMLLDPNDPRANPGPAPYRDAGRAWWDMKAAPGETMYDVAQRLGMRPAEVSAIKQGRQKPPESK